MSFRARLTLFFVLIVIVPMLSVAIVLFRLISDNETGKADASVAARQRTAINLYTSARDEAERAVRAVGADARLAAALRARDRGGAEARARTLLAGGIVERIAVVRDGAAVADVGDRTAVAPAVRELVDRNGRRFGRLEVSVTSAREYADEARRLIGVQVLVRRGGRTLASTLRSPVEATLPGPGRPRDIDVGDRSYRAVSFDAAGFLGRRVRVSTLARDAQRGSDINRSRLLAAGILLGFLVLALTFAVAVSRSLQAQIGSFLAAARRLASGDFSTDVPTTGRDEFAELGSEFNKMSSQLEERLEDLRQERARLATSLQRIGEAFASNLDREALLDLVVATAQDGVGADGARATARSADGPLEERARAGRMSGLRDAVLAAEAAALEAGEGREAERDGVHALAVPLRGSQDGTGHVLGILSVARRERRFEEREHELLDYLAGTAGVSIENVGLHETVQRQAITDELTGLFNHRRFQEAMASETERARRFELDLGLVMFDIDNFKRVNDTYGHQQGDRVLREVARVLQESSREVDAPARYGGEELAVVLPQTDLEGAYNLAERVRSGIEALDLEVPGGGGTMHVTASFGVAAMPETAGHPRELLSAADAALYQAKRSGKNKTVRAGARV